MCNMSCEQPGIYGQLKMSNIFESIPNESGRTELAS